MRKYIWTWYLITDDLKYLLCKPPDPDEWDTALRNNFTAGAKLIVQILEVIQVCTYYMNGESFVHNIR